jgi:hypothetical protein
MADSYPSRKQTRVSPCQKKGTRSSGRRTGKILTTFKPFPVQNAFTPPPCRQTARTAAGMLPAFRRGFFTFAVEPGGGGIDAGSGPDGEVMR